MDIQAKWTEDLNSNTYKDAIAIRHEVFVNEQNVPENLEIDELEDETLHIVLYDDTQRVATARILELEDNIYKIQRVAVSRDYREKGLGKQLMNEVENKVRELGGQKLTLGSQNTAIPFYEKLGYSIEGNEFMDAGIPHHTMVKTL